MDKVTTKDMEFFFHILSNMKNKLDVDWNVVAEKAGFKNANVARIRYTQIKKKLGWTADTTPTKSVGPSKTSSGTKRSSTKATKKPAVSDNNSASKDDDGFISTDEDLDGEEEHPKIEEYKMEEFEDIKEEANTEK